MATKISIAFANLKMRGRKKTHPNSTFLGYGDATILIALGEEEILNLRIRNMELKVVNGKFRVDFPFETAKDGKRYPTVFPKSALSRKRLTAAMLLAYNALHATSTVKITAA
jgi:hypothetical protein